MWDGGKLDRETESIKNEGGMKKGEGGMIKRELKLQIMGGMERGGKGRGVIYTAIPVFVNLNMPRYIKQELRNMIKTCIVIRLTKFISIHNNP